MRFFSIRRQQVIPAFCLIGMAGCGGNPQSYVERGNRFSEQGKLEDAALQYRKAIQKAPNLGDAHYRLGLLELRTNQPVPAYRELVRAVELMPGNDEALARLGQLSLGLYNADPKHPRQLYDRAAKAGAQLIAKKPDSFDGNLIEGAIALADKKPADAVRYLRAAVAAKPGDPDAQLGLARALAQNDQAQDGINVAQELIRKNKAFGPAYDFLFERYQSAGKKAEAGDVLRLKVANNPKQAAYIVELARYYAAMQQPPQVEATIAKLTGDPADFPDGRLMAGDFYLSVGKSNIALQQFNTGLGAASGTGRNVYRRRIAAIMAAQKKWPEAFQQIEAILKDQPNDDDAKLMRARAWLDEGKPDNLDRAIAELQAQSKKRPNDPTLHFQAGSALARKGDSEGARREWTAAAQANGEYLPPRYALAQMDLAQGKAAAALQVSEEIVAAAPRDAQAALLHATCLTAASQYPRARTELNRLIAQFPQAPQVRFRLGVLDLAEHKFKDAEDAFRQVQGAPAADPQLLAGLAEALQGENQSAKAIQLLQDAVSRNPNSPILRQVLARMAVVSGKHDIALEQYKQMAAAAPGSTPLQLALAAAYTANGDSGDAAEVLQKAVQSDPKSVPASLMLAQALLATGRVEDAKARYRHVIEIEPNNPNALNDLAYIMADSGDNLDQALSYAQRGLQFAVEPSLKTSLSDTLGWIYVKKNMTDNAVETFQNLVRSNPGNATFRYHLAAALYQKGDTQKARAELETALGSKPSPTEEPKIRQLLARL